MKTKTLLKRITAIFLALTFCMAFSSATTVLAEEIDSDTSAVENWSREEIDPNIKIVVTEITDSTPSPLLNSTSTYFDYQGSLVGITRNYTGNHFSVDLTTSSDNSGNFTLKLVRVDGFWTTTVGKVNLPQNGSFHVEFLDIYHPGDYRFEFQQDLFHNGHQTGEMTIWDWE